MAIDKREISAVTVRRGFWHRWIDAVLSIRCKATVMIVVLVLTVAGTVSGYLLDSSVKLARGQQDEQVVQLAAILAKAAAVTLPAEDPNALGLLAEKSANGSPLLYIIFFDKDGHELAAAEHGDFGIVDRLRRAGRAGSVMLGSPKFYPALDASPAFRDVTYPISGPVAADKLSHFQPSRLLGYVRVGMVANGSVRVLASTFDVLIGVGILVTVIAVPLGFLLIRRIVSPLESLTDSMQRFAEGQLEVRSPVRRSDEIGCLASAFNQMADQHEVIHEGLVRLNAELEERVALRTHQLRELASREPLTGLYNRRHFNEMLERRLSEAVRYDGDLSCVMIDLDDFKSVNDKFGHQAGDQVLILAATTINNQLRSADVAARFGGDEFILLLPQTDAEHAGVLAERICQQFRQELARRVPPIETGMSVGIASVRTAQASDPDALVRVADRALYQAKAKRKIAAVDAVSVTNTS